MTKRTKQAEKKGFCLPFIIVMGISLLPLLTMGPDEDGGTQDQNRTPEPAPEASVRERPKQQTGKAGHVFYLLAVFAVCALPLLAMGVRGETGTAENRTLASLPEPFDEKGFRWDYLRELGAYFDDHFAFRSELVTLDARVRTSVFGVSPVSDVIAGEDGWLYYAATLDDFQHKNPVSDRMLFNIAHNLSLMQQYTESLGMEFLFTVAPNKNSLYGENMPQRFGYQVEDESDLERLAFWLEQEQVNYVDLFGLFREQEEVLYYQRDSHWNGKGAVMVYNALLDACGKAHETYEDSWTQTSNNYYGDLNRMVFPAKARPEADIQYIGGNAWAYSTGETVEDSLVITESAKGSQTLLMYRDSFGNSLLPLMAGEFSQAVFSKRVPYPMTDLAAYWPDLVIVERVERHLPALGRVPPLMSAPEVVLDGARTVVESSAAFSLSKEGSYWKVSGVSDMEYMSTESRIFVEITDADGTKLYEAFCTGTAEDGSGDYGFTLYISELMLAGEEPGIKIITERENEIIVLKEENVTLPNGKMG